MQADWSDIVESSLNESIQVKQKLLENTAPILQSAEILAECLRRGGTVFLAGNGGSAADAQHIAAELVGRFEKDNQLPALALTTDSSCLTALANDFGYDTVFSRQVKALMRSGDVLIAISTSGNSTSINLAAQAARDKGCPVIGLTGKNGGKLIGLCSAAIVVPSGRTCRIQESHITVGHILCELIEHAEIANSH
ncbi:MAG: D-sedoheptulose 7-phosphate isomerase [bacterium]|nr:D-sedoheptulose 7-phosphate isomerase [bacterium]